MGTELSARWWLSLPRLQFRAAVHLRGHRVMGDAAGPGRYGGIRSSRREALSTHADPHAHLSLYVDHLAGSYGL